MMAMKMTGEALRDVRKRVRMNQGQFAQVMGAHLQTLSKWERGKIPVPHLVAVIASLIESDPVTRDKVEKMAGIE